MGKRRAAQGARTIGTDELRRRIHQFASFRFQGSLRNLFHFYSGGQRQVMRRSGLGRLLTDATPETAQYMGNSTTTSSIIIDWRTGEAVDAFRDGVLDLFDPGRTGFVRRQDFDRVFGN